MSAVNIPVIRVYLFSFYILLLYKLNIILTAAVLLVRIAGVAGYTDTDGCVVGIDTQGVLSAGVEPTGGDTGASVAHAVGAAVLVAYTARG